MHHTGTDLGQPFARRAIRFVLDRQNPDGGWGEWIDSYRDEARAGRGESSAPLTGLVATALVEVGLAETAELRRAIDYLVRTQRADGTWDNGRYVVPNVPPDTFYTYEGGAVHLPLEALARARAAWKSAAQSIA